MRRLVLGGLLLLVAGASACERPPSEAPSDTAASELPRVSASAVASASASAPGPTEAPATPAPVPPSAAALAALVARPCEASSARLHVSPETPSVDREQRFFVVSPTRPAPFLVFAEEGRAPVVVQAEVRSGPPRSSFARFTPSAQGKLRVIAVAGDEPVHCELVTIAAASKPSPRGGPQGIPWASPRSWDRAMEDLYSAWVEKLFDAPDQEFFSVGALHTITSDEERNFLHDHLGSGEDQLPPRGLRLDPDCADLPYFLRAYFSFKLGLPFAFSQCSRGGGGVAPRCRDPQSNLDPLDEPIPSRWKRFETFARVTLKNTVHSGTGRTLASDDTTDYYPIPLSRETLRPGAVYADPYGHILVVAKLVPQRGDTAGALFAVDGQPDGTVAKKRFWEGNFLFAQDEPAMGSPGFKRFRPIVRSRSGVRPLDNAEIAKHEGYGDYSLDQTKLDTTTFHDAMDLVLSPERRAPGPALLSVIGALEEQVRTRVLSVDNGARHFRDGGGRIDMPSGAAIFETTGDWENFSTPSRDLRLLIAIDVVARFPRRVEQHPERFVLPSGKSPSAVAQELEALAAAELTKRTFSYPRSDGSSQTLTLADVVARAEALEVAFNPNDCQEHRWGAPAGSPEAATCKRRAPTDQARKMEKARAWFKSRKRPSRG